VALVTGAGQGIGRQVALAFAVRGVGAVVVSDHDGDRAQAMARELEAMGTRAIAAPADVTYLRQARAMVARAESAVGPIEILVNAAGDAECGAPHADDGAPWLEPSFFGVLNCTRAVVGGMVERRYGRIVAIVSDPGRGVAVHCGAKAGAAGFMRALAKAVAYANVTANCVSRASTPGEPGAAADLVLLLASGAAASITGRTFPAAGRFARVT
jgi:3-oxoacyl-[acyl-carrier protein] reductase